MKTISILILSILPVIASGIQQPNVIIILADDVGIGDIKCYYEPSKVQTPNIDKLAADGMRFTQAYAPGSVCSPSRYGLITGFFPCRGPLKDQNARYTSPLSIDESSLTLPRLFKQQGYRTAHIGKWHLGYGETGITNWAGEIKPGPLELGFDYHLGLPTNHSDNFNTYVENHQLLWLKDEVTDLPGKPTKDQLTQIRYDDEVDTTLTAKAIEFIREDPDEPFFICLALVAVHTHVTPHEKFRGTSEIGQLGDYIHELDSHVGEIVATVKELGLSENTLIIFTSDNGGQKNDFRSAGKNLNLRVDSHNVAKKAKNAKTVAMKQFEHQTNGDFRGYKGSNYEGGFRVPFIASWPGEIPAGTESDQMIVLTDLLATSTGILGVELPKLAGGDSFDLSPVMFGEQVDGSIRNSAILQTGRNQLAFRYGDWKIVSTEETEWMGSKANIRLETLELYNLANDPLEENNLASQESERVAELHRLLLGQIAAGHSR